MSEKKTDTKEVAKTLKEKSGGFFGEFKKFISRGNVIDLAVGVIVGGAFTAIVNSLVNDILMPVIGMLLAGVNFSKLGFTIPWGNEPYINVGSFIQAVITFILTAFCVFILVKFINSVHKKKEAPKTTPDDVKLLTEIRDLMKMQMGIVDEEEVPEAENPAEK